jgi:hypothetical protein
MNYVGVIWPLIEILEVPLPVELPVQQAVPKTYRILFHNKLFGTMNILCHLTGLPDFRVRPPTVHDTTV